MSIARSPGVDIRLWLALGLLLLNQMLLVRVHLKTYPQPTPIAPLVETTEPEYHLVFREPTLQEYTEWALGGILTLAPTVIWAVTAWRGRYLSVPSYSALTAAVLYLIVT